MRINQVPGNKPDRMAVAIRNNAGATIPVGTPVALEISGTNDGLDVILPSSSAAKAHAFAYGVCLSALADQQLGEAQVFGFCANIVILRQTRTASGESWSSNSDGFGTGVILVIDTVNNAFSTSGGTLAKTAYLPFAVLAAAVGSWAASASATSDTRTAVTTSAKAFLRML